jgi:hypothetical protein
MFEFYAKLTYSDDSAPLISGIRSERRVMSHSFHMTVILAVRQKHSVHSTMCWYTVWDFFTAVIVKARSFDFVTLWVLSSQGRIFVLWEPLTAVSLIGAVFVHFLHTSTSLENNIESVGGAVLHHCSISHLCRWTSVPNIRIYFPSISSQWPTSGFFRCLFLLGLMDHLPYGMPTPGPTHFIP